MKGLKLDMRCEGVEVEDEDYILITTPRRALSCTGAVSTPYCSPLSAGRGVSCIQLQLLRHWAKGMCSNAKRGRKTLNVNLISYMVTLRYAPSPTFSIAPSWWADRSITENEEGLWNT